jgi:hypothetical protein
MGVNQSMTRNGPLRAAGVDVAPVPTDTLKGAQIGCYGFLP